MTPRSLVAVGGSAGGLEALIRLVGGLPADLPASVLVSIHIGEQAQSRLPEILSRSGPLPARYPVGGARLRAGTIYVAPPGAHLVLNGQAVMLSDGPRLNRLRPAVDAMFASAARWFDGRTVAVVLSGLLDDGAVGAALIAQAGGQVVVQDPEEAAFPSMPRAALAASGGRVEATDRLAEVVTKMVTEQSPAEGTPEASTSWTTTPEQAMHDTTDPQYVSAEETRLTRMACPECGGVLAEARLPRITYYRCHVGHQFGPQSLAAAQADSAEAKLWAAVAALEESAAFARHLSEHATDDDPAEAEAHGRAAEQASALAESVRARLRTRPGPPGERSAGEDATA